MARMSLQAAFEQAREWLEANDLERAIGLCEHILQSYPNNLEAQRILGEACLANRQLERAQAAFESVLRSDPENIPAHVGLGITFERRSKIERAAQEFERALEIKPDMPELRSQLLRIYSDGGIENPQLRLSRAGLARLYAKGQMLPQAINEFRQVIKDQPDRSDAKVALAETLWRNEQESDAASLCRSLLAENPYLLKARLLLGYIEQASGRPDGVEHWRAAAEMDPYQTVAQAMFEPLPARAAADVSIDEWDEAAWRQRRVEEEVEQIDATRPMQAVPAAVEPEPEPEFMPGTGFFNRQPAPAAEMADTSDDFLASLLSFASPAPAADVAATPPAAEIADNVTAPSADTPTTSKGDDLDLGDMQPFSFADLGLNDDEIAGLASLETLDSAPEAPAAEPVDDRSTQVFSADDFGDLDTESMPAFEFDESGATDEAGDSGESDQAAAPAADFDTSDWAADLDALSLDLDEAEQPEAKAAPQPADDDDLDLSSIAPFSLAELGLSDEEIASLGQAEPADTSSTPSAERSPFHSDLLGELPADLEPFSIDELDQPSEEGGSLPASLQPFSLDDAGTTQRPRVSGLMPDEISDSDEDEANPNERPGFSWQEPSQRSEPQFVSSLRRDEPPPEGSLFDKLKQLRQNEPPPEPEPLPQVSLDENEHLGLFSLDNESLRDERTSGQQPGMPNIAGIAQREGTALPPRNQPATSPQPPAPLPPERREPPIDEEGSISADALEPFTLAELGLNDEEIAALGLSESAPSASSAGSTSHDETDDVEPFSLAGLDDDLPALDLGDTGGETSFEPESLSFEGFDLEDDLPALDFGDEPAEEPSEPLPIPDVPGAEVPEDLQSGLESGEIKPFSLADLGLSDEEIAQLGLDDTAATAPAHTEDDAADASELQSGLDSGEIQPFSLADLDKPQASEPATALPIPDVPGAEVPEDLQSGLESGEIKPFSLADLGLSDEEIAQLGLADTQTPTEPAPSSGDTTVDDDLQPFSLLDLGLEDDAPAETPSTAGMFDVDDSRLELTDEELAGLDIGGDVNLNDAVAEPAAGRPNTGDAAADRLVALGRSRGYIDISDIIAAVDDPENESERIEWIGRVLHAEQIEIRDGDEVIDMDAEYADDEELLEPETPVRSASDEEPDLTPFSLSELGLSDEEIEMLGTTAESQDTAPSASEEPDLMPFSLDTPASDVTPATPAPTQEEPDLMPFSLEDSGEVQAQAEVPPAATPVPPAPAAPPPTTNATDDLLAQYQSRVDNDPENHSLRLSVARASLRLDRLDMAVRQYKQLIRRNVLLDDIVDDLNDMIADNDDTATLRQLHRVLGDAYTAQGHLDDAMDVYSWIPGKPKITRS